MNSPIVDALPGINSSLVGFGGALYAAYALYGYQKVFEAKNIQLDIRDEIRLLQNSGNTLGISQEYKDHLGDYEFWMTNVRKSVQNSLKLHAHLDIREDDYPPLFEKPENQPKDQDFFDNFLKFCSGIEFAIQSSTRLNFTRSNLAHLRDIFGSLSRFILGHRVSIFQLCNDAYESRANMTKRQPWDLRRILDDYIQKVDLMANEILPRLTRSNQTILAFSNKFQLERDTIRAILFIIWILFFGIFGPITMQSIGADLQFSWPMIFKYLLLILNLAPYLTLCFWLTTKVCKTRSEASIGRFRICKYCEFLITYTILSIDYLKKLRRKFLT